MNCEQENLEKQQKLVEFDFFNKKVDLLRGSNKSFFNDLCIFIAAVFCGYVALGGIALMLPNRFDEIMSNSLYLSGLAFILRAVIEALNMSEISVKKSMFHSLIYSMIGFGLWSLQSLFNGWWGNMSITNHF